MNRFDPPGGSEIPAGINLEALVQAPFSLVITNASLPENPIVFVNAAFERTTGYSADDAVGRNCRFLQGPGTDPQTVDRLRTALANRTNITVDILNYRADGSEFWNRLFISPLHPDPEQIPYFLGIQTDLHGSPTEFARLIRSEQALVELRHRVKNHLAMVVGMIRLQARKSGIKGEFQSIARRVEALQLLYEDLSGIDRRGGTDGAERTQLLGYSARIGESLVRLEPALNIDIKVSGDAIAVDLPVATQIGLALSELITNSLKHGYDEGDHGQITVHFDLRDNAVLRVTVQDDGHGFDPDLCWPDPTTLGGRILTQLVDDLGGKLLYQTGPHGTRIWFDMPKAGATAV